MIGLARDAERAIASVRFGLHGSRQSDSGRGDSVACTDFGCRPVCQQGDVFRKRFAAHKEAALLLLGAYVM